MDIGDRDSSEMHHKLSGVMDAGIYTMLGFIFFFLVFEQLTLDFIFE